MTETHRPLVSRKEALVVWSRVAGLSFGGPAGQIAVMHRILVEEKKWISEARFLHALNYCMLLPGPEAQQLATYIGWLLRGFSGGLVAGGLFVLPGFFSILALSTVYVLYKGSFFLSGLFFGLKPAIIAIVFAAVFKIAKRSLKTKAMVWVSASAFLGLALFAVPFPVIIVAAALIGFAGGTYFPAQFDIAPGHAVTATEGNQAPEDTDLISRFRPVQLRPTWGRSCRVFVFFMVLWWAPVLTLLFTLGSSNVFSEIGLFFSKASVVTFGGAYALLAYLAQQAVHHYQWLQPQEMMDGLGMAETTPGPLIQVTQFVGFMGAYGAAQQGLPGTPSPLMAGVLASLLTTWVTYVPCFLWIFLGAPYIEFLRSLRKLSCALSSISAAVVGVILNLAFWFSLHVLFKDVVVATKGLVQVTVPNVNSLDVSALALTLLAMAVMFKLRWNMFQTMAATVVVGFALIWMG